ncbi:hypothetical protein N0V88_007298 [Collariella sp. IMI 366227]|nr:hypothetical protein N0V88_007298 [Collariella sp. IMI 366227]
MPRYIPLNAFACATFGLLDLELPSFFPSSGEGVRTRPLPGVKCPTCAANGEDVWVIPGLLCAKCRTPAPDDGVETYICHHNEHEQ